MKMTNHQKIEVMRALEAAPLADIETSLVGVEVVLELALQVTHDDFLRWEDEGAVLGYGDELALDTLEVAAMPTEWRLAYVARLLRTLALDLGIGTEFSGKLGERRNDADALAPLLRRLCAIATSLPQQDVTSLAEGLLWSRRLRDRVPSTRRGWYLQRAQHQAEATLAAIRDLVEASQGRDA